MLPSTSPPVRARQCQAGSSLNLCPVERGQKRGLEEDGGEGRGWGDGEGRGGEGSWEGGSKQVCNNKPLSPLFFFLKGKKEMSVMAAEEKMGKKRDFFSPQAMEEKF